MLEFLTPERHPGDQFHEFPGDQKARPHVKDKVVQREETDDEKAKGKGDLVRHDVLLPGSRDGIKGKPRVAYV